MHLGRVYTCFQVRVCADEDAILQTSRAAGIAIDSEKDGVRAACAGKTGTVLQVDSSDQTAKVRVNGEATIWFAIAAIEPAS